MLLSLHLELLEDRRDERTEKVKEEEKTWREWIELLGKGRKMRNERGEVEEDKGLRWKICILREVRSDVSERCYIVHFIFPSAKSGTRFYCSFKAFITALYVLVPDRGKEMLWRGEVWCFGDLLSCNIYPYTYSASYTPLLFPVLVLIIFHFLHVPD